MVEKVEAIGYRNRWPDGSTSICVDPCHDDDGTSEPLMTVAQHERIVAGLEARLREARGLLIDARFDMHAFPSQVKDRIDAFLAQMAEGVVVPDPLRELVTAVEAEFCGPETDDEPDDSKVSYPEERCHITFGMIRRAKTALTNTLDLRIACDLIEQLPEDHEGRNTWLGRFGVDR